jgi:DNA-directed RNA polymerase beta subunit
LAVVGSRTRHGQSLIGVVLESGSKRKSGTKRRSDRSITCRTRQGWVTHSELRTSLDGTQGASVVVTDLQIAQNGTKLSTQHAQKGVVADTVPQHEMPYVERTGERGVVLQNCEGFPTRQTTGQPRGGWRALALALRGDSKTLSGNAFEDRVEDDRLDAETLTKYGLHYQGYLKIRDPVTGKVAEGWVFRGIEYFSNLPPHDATGKAFARGVGSVNPATGQAMAGVRSVNDRGFRVGRMEGTALMGNNSSSFGWIRLVHMADYEPWPVCQRCGYMVDTVNLKRERAMCKFCGTGKHIVVVDGLKSTRMAMTREKMLGVVPRWHVEPTDGIVRGEMPRRLVPR